MQAPADSSAADLIQWPLLMILVSGPKAVLGIYNRSNLHSEEQRAVDIQLTLHKSIRAHHLRGQERHAKKATRATRCDAKKAHVSTAKNKKAAHKIDECLKAWEAEVEAVRSIFVFAPGMNANKVFVEGGCLEKGDPRIIRAQVQPRSGHLTLDEMTRLCGHLARFKQTATTTTPTKLDEDSVLPPGGIGSDGEYDGFDESLA